MSHPEFRTVLHRRHGTIARVIVLVGVLAACGAGDGGGDVTATTGLNLDQIVLTPDGLGEVVFGATEEEVIDALSPFLGGFDTDSRWTDGRSGIYGACPEHLRVLSWGSLSVFFTTADGAPPRPDLESGRFFAYTYGFDFDDALGGVDPRDLDLATVESIGLGTPGTVLEQLDTEVTFTEDSNRNILEFAITPDDDPHLRGTLAGPNRTDPISFIETSSGCS